MQKDIKNKLPKWANTKQDRNLTLSNDMDSLILSSLLKDLFGYVINHFYSFSRFATLDQSDKRLSIGCDLALNKGFTFCNHLVMLSPDGYKNPDSINLNNALNISNQNYSKKFNLSSLVTAWSYYDLPLPQSEEGKMILLAIDSAYMGYRNPQYQYIMEDWLERLQMTELIDLLKKYSQADFEKFAVTNQLKAGIKLDKNNQLAFTLNDNPYSLFDDKVDLEWISKHLGFEVALPKGEFNVIGGFDYHNIEVSDYNKRLQDNTFSMAITYRDKLSLSTFKRGA